MTTSKQPKAKADHLHSRTPDGNKSNEKDPGGKNKKLRSLTENSSAKQMSSRQAQESPYAAPIQLKMSHNITEAPSKKTPRSPQTETEKVSRGS